MEKGEYKLTPREWYFYSLLAARWSPFLGICETTVTAISNVQTSFQDKSKPTRDKTNTWEQIKNLETRGLIKILDDNIVTGSRYNYDQVIQILFNDLGDGFEQISPKLYYLSSDPIEIYFLCVISRFKNKGFSHTYEGLSELLGCSESNIHDLVKQMKKKKLITYEQGRRDRLKDGTYTRKANTYYLCDEKVEMEEDIIIPLEQDETESKFITILGELTLQDIQRKIKHSNWGTKGVNLKEDDIDIMLICEDADVELSFTKRCRNTLNSWTKKGNDMTSINKWIEQYNYSNDKKKEEFEKMKLEQSIVNAIIVDGETIILDKNNVNKISFDEADEIYYFDNDGKNLMRGNFKYLAGNENVSDEMRKRAVNEYKKIIIKGEKLTMKVIMEIRDRVNV